MRRIWLRVFSRSNISIDLHFWQLTKQMCISADFEGAFEIGPGFRVEDSNRHRHPTEYVGLGLEIALPKDYHETFPLIDNLLEYIF